jgi:DNA polymerase/3'-5' exonuclease PolX
MMQQLVNGMNESKRPFLLDVLVTRNAEIVGQVSSCDRMSEVGSLRRIRGKITTLDVKLTTTEQHDGSSKATHSQNGNHRLILFFGFMESVCTAFS